MEVAWHLCPQAPLFLYALQGPHDSRGASLKPASIDGGQCEAQKQQGKLTDFPQCEVNPGSLWCQDAEVDEGTAQGDVKIDWEDLALHQSKCVPREAPKKQEA